MGFPASSIRRMNSCAFWSTRRASAFNAPPGSMTASKSAGFALSSTARRAVDSLFRRLAVEMLVVGLRVLAGMVDDAVPMIRRRIERIELQWNTAGINDVMIRPSRDDYCEASADRRPNAIENRLTGPLLHAKELVELVDFRPDLFLGL